MAEPMTIDEITTAIEQEMLGRSIFPLSCDLTGDRIACAILRQWARQPWQPVHRAALLDRMEELGKEEQESEWLRKFSSFVCFDYTRRREVYTRTRFHKFLLIWRRELIRHFGDFESILL